MQLNTLKSFFFMSAAIVAAVSAAVVAGVNPRAGENKRLYPKERFICISCQLPYAPERKNPDRSYIFLMILVVLKELINKI